MRKILLLGVMALSVSAASPAFASKFGFYTPSGTPYCDGVNYWGAKPAVGVHDYDGTTCPYPYDQLGGYESTIPALGPGKWFTFPVSFSDRSPISQEYVYTFYINPRALTWVMAYESTDNHLMFTILSSGILKQGGPGTPKSGQKVLGSVISEAMAKLKK